ncbi:multidrug effflux MFS transporter [Gallaecimonas pentaromativorans]|uniref:Bcr/CflA family efflux transporter n=1 Tax=Gallaecimonas pentaromativorans TaxID=584787 RepID=A0A3N1NUP9_9GAMM|nr:multidrug effflux MFS transporter [Gallaecimonas pentaromativorans]ROQ18938.1 DHA1 family bicyclomycin/chloramphenicol resistance-like MFS transporter [Gallaecimonas pentaromativorans]
MVWFKWLLLCLVLFSPLGIDIYLPAIPAIADSLGSSQALVQSTISLFLLMMGLGQLVAGPLADRFGRRPVAMAGIVIYLAGALLAVLSTSGWLFVLSRLIQGSAVCATSVVAFSAVRDRMDGQQSAQAYSFLNGALNIVPALAPLLGGLLAERFGWQAPFWFLALYALALLLVVWRFLPETLPAGTQVKRGIPFGRYLAMLRQGPFLAFALVNATGMGMVLTYVSLAPTVLMNQAGLSPLGFSLVFGANALWILTASLLANWVIRRFGRRACLGFALAWLLAAVLALAATTLGEAAPAWGYMLPVTLACSGFACSLGPATSMALAPFGDEAGVAAALVLCLQMAGASLIGITAVALPLAPQWALWGTIVLAALLVANSLRVAKGH